MALGALLEAPGAENKRPRPPLARRGPGRAGPRNADRLSLWGGRPPLKNLITLGSIIIGSLDHRIGSSLRRIVCPGSDTPMGFGELLEITLGPSVLLVTVFPLDS